MLFLHSVLCNFKIGRGLGSYLLKFADLPVSIEHSRESNRSNLQFQKINWRNFPILIWNTYCNITMNLHLSVWLVPQFPPRYAWKYNLLHSTFFGLWSAPTRQRSAIRHPRIGRCDSGSCSSATGGPLHSSEYRRIPYRIGCPQEKKPKKLTKDQKKGLQFKCD